jgi:hypothetical protein
MVPGSDDDAAELARDATPPAAAGEQAPAEPVSEVSVLGAKLEGMAVMLRDMARVALAGAALAAVALLVGVYALLMIRRLQAA